MARRSTRRPVSPLEQPDPRFEGSAYSNAELAFLIEHLGEPAIVAMPPEEELPEGVNEAAVGPLLDRLHQLALYEQSVQERHSDETIKVWCGFDAIREVCRKTIEWRNVRLEMVRRTNGQRGELRRAAGAPTLHMWDPSTGVPTLGGVGADSDRVLTRFNDKMQREELHVEVQQTGTGTIKSMAGLQALIKKQEVPELPSNKLMDTTPDNLVYEEGETYGVVKCPLCERSESYPLARSAEKRKSINRVIRHLLEEKVVRVEAHRLLHTRIKTGRAGASSNRIPVAVGE